MEDLGFNIFKYKYNQFKFYFRKCLQKRLKTVVENIRNKKPNVH